LIINENLLSPWVGTHATSITKSKKISPQQLKTTLSPTPPAKF